MTADLIQIQNRLKGTARQRAMTLRAAGEEAEGRFSLADQLFTAGWREELLLSGCCFGVTVGGISAGGDVSLITGGGAGTTIDSDQPELIVSVPAGYYLIPLRAQGAFRVDLDADAEVGDVLLFADTTQAAPATATATAETPVPLLGGDTASVARAWSAVTADITDPVLSHLLAYVTVLQSQTTAASISNQTLVLDYQPKSPPILKGPCSIVLCWGGTAAVTGLASLEWAEIPATRIH